MSVTQSEGFKMQIRKSSASLGFLILMAYEGEYVWFVNKTLLCHITLILFYSWDFKETSNNVKKGVKSLCSTMEGIPFTKSVNSALRKLRFCLK